MKRKSDKSIYLLLLHLLLAFFSLSGICSKSAAAEPFLSLRFCVFYGGTIVILVVYAIGWQQIIKRLPLTTAYANKAVTVVWGLIWGVIFFGEKVAPRKCIGILLVIAGIVLYAVSEGTDEPSPVTFSDSLPREERDLLKGDADE